MKTKLLFTSFLISTFFILSPIQSLAEWAYSFVVWDGYIYVVSDEVVQQIDQEIGHVTSYSDIEGTSSGNFSNTFFKGTKYYSIKNVNTYEAIAIETQDGNFIKAVREGLYAGSKSDEGNDLVVTQFNYANLLIGFLALFPILAFVGYFGTKRLR